MGGEVMGAVTRVPRPVGVRSVSLLFEHDLGHYPEFRTFLAREFNLERQPFAAPPVLKAGSQLFELVFVGRSGAAFPSGLEINALVAGLEPMEEDAAERGLWDLVCWLAAQVGGEWTVEDLARVASIYRIQVPAADGR